MKENSSPDSIVLKDTKTCSNLQSNEKSIRQNQPGESLHDSSDLDLELPSHFGRRSTSIDESKVDNDSFIEDRNAACSKSLTLDEQSGSNNLILPNSTSSVQNAAAIKDQTDLEKKISPEIPKKRYLIIF